MRIHMLGRREYAPTWRAMRAFTLERDAQTADELWLVEHPPVYTQGIAGRAEHLLRASEIACVRTDRGGQITYHGPGQVVAYPLVDLRRLGIYVKEYVFRLERAVLDVLALHGVTGHRVAGAPGIYVRRDDPFGLAPLPAGAAAAKAFDGLAKIAALGVKISNHCTYHGVALNVAMDLSPFEAINPCGYAGLATVDLATLGIDATWETIARQLGQRLSELLSP
ncbi:MAG: lipoyl(octanoyl) transferase LipB [Burkholderiaceae bacterium]